MHSECSKMLQFICPVFCLKTQTTYTTVLYFSEGYQWCIPNILFGREVHV